MNATMISIFNGKRRGLDGVEALTLVRLDEEFGKELHKLKGVRLQVLLGCRPCRRCDDPRYRVWRTQVLELADRICRACGELANVAHHIRNYADWPEERYVLKNGAALCEPCHIAYHKRWGKTRTTYETRETFGEWLAWKATQ